MEIFAQPNDVLFFRDSTPMAAGEGYGKGCNIPLPSVFHSALRTALIRQTSSLPNKRTVSKHTSIKNKRYGVDKFGSLQTNGIYPYHTKHGVLFKIPNDVLLCNAEGVKISKLKKFGNRVITVSTIPPQKDKPTGFWTAEQMNNYLNGIYDCDMTPIPESELWQPEWKVGVEIDNMLMSSKDKKLYAGEYMRMNDNAGFFVDIKLHEIETLKPIKQLTLGGERRLCTIQQFDNTFPKWEIKPNNYSEGEYLLKWILLSPTIFRYGSIPGWIEENKVMLKPKINGVRENIDAELISSITASPIPISGWDSISEFAKPSILAVNTGAVYYFKCKDFKNAQILQQALHTKCRSDMLAEKGFGFGITSIEKLNIN